AAAVYKANWFTPDGTEVTGLAVDPDAYAALVAATQGYPAVAPALLARPAGTGTPQPVLASASAAAVLGPGTISLSTPGRDALSVPIAGTLSGTPALPGDAQAISGGVVQAVSSAFVILPMAAVRSAANPSAP